MEPDSVRNLPPKPRSVEETGLTITFLTGLALKTMYAGGSLMGHEIADSMKLPFANVTDKALDSLRRERLIEVGGSAGIGEASYQYVISRAGRVRARELMDQNNYVGPAPVSLQAYNQMVKSQSVTGQAISQDTLKRALSHLVLSNATIHHLGPAVNAGKSIFLFGNTGDGKTSIGLAIGTLLPGVIWIPYAVTVDGQIIKVFDTLHHRAISEKTEPETHTGVLRYLAIKGERYDQRWVPIHRPLIVGGGELTVKNLDLVFDPTMKYYEAPHQMKANGGVFLLDDLGRQQDSPRTIFNRWIVPLEKRVDYLTLATGHKIDVPFDALIVFATNLNPKELVDEAFLRRIRYRIHIPDPTWEEFREIFMREAAKRTIPYSEDGLGYIVTEYYTKPKRKPRGVHPRDILDELVDIARFRGVPPRLSKELMDLACQAYFLTG